MKAFDFAFHHPVREAKLLGLKLFAFWNGAESFDNYDPSFIRQNFPTFLNLPLPRFPLIVMLAAFAFVAGRRLYAREMGFFAGAIAIYMLSVIAFYVTDRYRLPVVVFLLPLAGAAIPQAAQLWRERDIKNLALAGAVAIVFLAAGLAPAADATDLTAFDYGTLVAVYADKGDVNGAITAFNKGNAISGAGIGVQAYVRAAEMEEKQGHARNAERLIEQMATMFPDDGVAQYNLGRLQAKRGDISAALWSFKAAQRLTPSYVLTYYALALIYNRMGDKAAAQKAIADGLAINPEDERLKALWEK
jgi:tetratricopeptide (TPR) repeat protein